MHDTNAERALLALVLERGDDVFDAVDLRPEDFHHMGYRKAWGVFSAMRRDGVPTSDRVSFEAGMGKTLDAVGGLSHFTGAMLELAPIPSMAPTYAETIRRTALTRRAVDALGEVLHGDAEGEDLVGALMSAAVSLADDRRGDSTATIVDAAREACDALSSDAGLSGLPTGFDQLDAILGGMQRGVMTILAARPSMGKSAMARSICAAAAAAGHGVHTFSLEDTRASLALREISDRAKVSGEALRNRDLQRGDLQRIGHALYSLRSLKGGWLVDDAMGLSVQDIAVRARRHKRENATELVVVDHAQLLCDPRVEVSNETAIVSVASRELSMLARQEDMAVLLVSQLNRKVEERSDKHPILADLRQSGSLEQDAYAVVMLYRDEYYHDETEHPGIAEVLIRKNKNGRTGSFEVWWDAKTATMRPLSRREEAA